MSLSLSYPPGPIPTGLCLRGETYYVFLGWVGQWGVGAEVGGSRGCPPQHISAFFFFNSQIPTLLQFANH